MEKHRPTAGGTISRLYVLGLPFLQRRSSSFICGLEHDAVDLADSVGAHLRTAARVA